MSSRYEQASLVDDPSSEKHDDKLEPQEEYSLVREVLTHNRTTKHRLVRMHVLRYHVMIKNSEQVSDSCTSSKTTISRTIYSI